MAFSMMTKPKVHYKNRDLFDNLNVFFGESANLARIKFLLLMILALYKVQTVANIPTLSSSFSNKMGDFFIHCLFECKVLYHKIHSPLL